MIRFRKGLLDTQIFYNLGKELGRELWSSFRTHLFRNVIVEEDVINEQVGGFLCGDLGGSGN